LTRPEAGGKIPEEINQVFREAGMDAQERIKQQVSAHPVVLYMKGTPQFPQCGFSANVVQILKACGAQDLFTVNVLEDPEIRQGIKEFANWPTIPQLYVKGEFIGGSDIIGEMYQSGELQKLLSAQTA
jgi:monothiol glutaredoxin